MSRLSIAIIAIVSSIAFTQIASAGDLSVKAPGYTPPPPAYSWTGFYIGGSAGYGWSNPDTTLSLSGTDFGGTGLGSDALRAIPTNLTPHSQGALGGIQVGYNVQTSAFVWGLEADFSGTDIRGSDIQDRTVITVVGFPFSMESKTQNSLDFFGTLRGRAGFAPVNNFLVYGTGGFAYGKVESSTSFSDVPTDLLATPASGSASAVLAGWTAGGGFESRLGFAPNWSVKVEYLYYDLGKLSYNLSSSTITSTGFGVVGLINGNATTEFKGSIARVGLNYRFQ